ncbi:MAG: FAD-dependent oxidoreductase [Planctomycetota bacterium]|jgi:NADPH-dependent 2,4-dienoyl-CoA reductase/sulfur reductase-like enzyme/nitrite reductase/ring-hydroxylating ferredoxin subunit
MTVKEWTRVAREDELEEGVPFGAKLGEKDIIIVRLNGRIFACGGKCPHYGGPLEEGLVTDHSVTCPWHSARFDVTTGDLKAPPALDDICRCEVKVDRGQVYIGRAIEPQRPMLPATERETYVIIGAGAAGSACAETLRREGFIGRIVMITAEAELPYDRPSLSKGYMNGTVGLEEVPLRHEGFYDERAIDVITRRRVTELDPRERVVTLDSGERIPFDKALVATGAAPRRLEIPGADLEGVFALRSMRDAIAIFEASRGIGRVAVVGAGFIGMEVAASLRKRGLGVDVIAPEQVPMLRTFGERVGRWIEALHERNGVRFHLGRAPVEIRGDGRAREVVLGDGGRVECDMVVVGVGVRPAVEFLAGAGLVEKGAIPVNERLETRVPGIYAAGDVALVPDHMTRELQRIEHWVVAERQGAHAARAMLGSDAPYDEVPFYWTRQFDVSIQCAGFAPEWDRVAVRGSVEEGSFLAGYYSNGDLRAVAGSGRAIELLSLAQLMKIGRKLPFGRFRDDRVDVRAMLREATRAPAGE